jgi:hypothetical protein
MNNTFCGFYCVLTNCRAVVTVVDTGETGEGEGTRTKTVTLPKWNQVTFLKPKFVLILFSCFFPNFSG